MENYLNENEEYEVRAECNQCSMRFGARVPKKDVDSVKCVVCESSDIHVMSSEPVRQILME